jgi:uncharacterized protein with WD repeat
VLQVWQLSSGAVVLSLFQRSFSRDAWPSVQFVADESLAFHQVTNAINIYACADWAAGESRRLSILSLSSGTRREPSRRRPEFAVWALQTNSHGRGAMELHAGVVPFRSV